jgi:hypothetical protein
MKLLMKLLMKLCLRMSFEDCIRFFDHDVELEYDRDLKTLLCLN